MGDRRQELVCIGCDMRRPELAAALDACLVTDAELAPGRAQLPDPFAQWPRCAALCCSGRGCKRAYGCVAASRAHVLDRVHPPIRAVRRSGT